jgi:hypothetical protein
LDNFSFEGREIIVLGERDGIGGPALAEIAASLGGNVVLSGVGDQQEGRGEADRAPRLSGSRQHRAHGLDRDER